MTASLGPLHQWIAASGAAVGYKLYTYMAETTTPLATYADEDYAAARTNPIVLDANGSPGSVFFLPQKYKLILKTAADVQVGDPWDNFDPGAADDSETFTNNAALAASGDRRTGAVYFTQGYGSVLGKGWGVWTWDSSNLAAKVALDAGGGVFLPPTGQDGSTGAYRRAMGAAYNVCDFGAIGLNVDDDTTAINRARLAAYHNLGMLSSAKGYPAVYFPPGQYKTTGITANYPGEKWIGEGALLVAASGAQFVVRKAAARVVIRDFTFWQPFFPTTTHGVVEHTDGTDCELQKIQIIGGYHALKLYGATAGDSKFDHVKCYDTYSDVVNMENYSGFWGFRCKFDEHWPVSDPTNSNIKGSWATGTVYVAGDIVLNDGWYFQCKTGGTSAASGDGPQPALHTTDVTDNTVVWLTQCTENAANVRIGSLCTFQEFYNCDKTNGRIYSEIHEDGDATFAPQQTTMVGGEMGKGLLGGLLATESVAITLSNVVIGRCVSSTAVAVDLVDTEHVIIDGCRPRTANIGVRIGASAKRTRIEGCAFADMDTCVSASAGATDFQVLNNDMGGSDTWGTNADGVTVAAGASDYYEISGNNLNGVTGTAITDGGTGLNKKVQIASTGMTVGGIQALSGAGAIGLTSKITKWTTTGAGNAGTLADGVQGQEKIIVHVVDGGSGVLTPTNLANGTTITFTNVGEAAHLVFMNTEWHVVALYGAVLA
jgi:hypothetical protein